MKTLQLVLAMVIACIIFQTANAQSDKIQRTGAIKTVTIKVYGECSMCRKTIEKAAFTVAGIQSANWNENSKQLTLTYDIFKKAAVDNVQKKIAAAGYDTESYRADDATVQKLPDCCKIYQRKQS